MRHFNLIRTLTVVCALIIVGNSLAQAGPSGSISYDFLPYQGIDEPIELEDGTTVDDAQVRLSKLRTTFTYAVVFSEGRTVMVNEISYQLIEFKYRKTTSLLERLHSVRYTLMLQHRLSEKWSVLALGTPSLASDLKGEVSVDDFSFQVAAVFIRHLSERLSIGLGAAYSTQFGSAVPLPVLTFDWNNGENLTAKAILPTSIEFWYSPSQRVDLGLLVFGDGNNFRFDPDTYQVANPELRYTMLTVGPTAKINLSKHVCLNVEAGIIGLHRFEFYDGDNEIVSNDLKPSQYFRLGLQSGF